MSCARWIPKATNTHSGYVTHCFPTVKVFTRTRLSVMLDVHCLSFYLFVFTLVLLCQEYASQSATIPCWKEREGQVELSHSQLLVNSRARK